MHCQPFIVPRARQLHDLADQCLGRTFDRLELTPTQSRILGYLVRNRHKVICPRDVEEVFSLSHPTVSGILCRLAHKGFVTFGSRAGDRRCKRIQVTEKALVFRAQVESAIDQVEDRITENFTEEEKVLFSSLLDRAIRSLGGEPCHVPKKEESESC